MKSASVWLDRKTGTFRWEGLAVGPALRAEEVERLPGAARWLDYGNGYRQRTLPQGELGGAPMLVSLHFAPDRSLWAVYLTTRAAGDLSGWKDWNEEAELAVKARNDAWLAQTLGPPPYRWDWGTIHSAFDARSGESRITLRYTATA